MLARFTKSRLSNSFRVEYYIFLIKYKILDTFSDAEYLRKLIIDQMSRVSHLPITKC